jgi:twitching motility two-component system response regulator PilH
LARKILLADDSVTAQNMGRKILSDAGYDVVTVNNGSAALKRVADLKPDLIVLDVYMPGYSGLEVCQRLKDSPDTERTPVLLTVGKLEPFKPEEARRVRADAYIIKPFEASELLTALARMEDRMVPGQRDGSRFSATAAGVEHFTGAGSSRKSESEGETDAGWKSRLRFPSKKKKEEPEPEPDMDMVGGLSFRNFRRGKSKASSTATEKSAPTPLEPGVVPRDITPEELDALSALAAKLDAPATETEETAAPVMENATPVEAKAEFEIAAPPREEKTAGEVPVPDAEPQGERETPVTNALPEASAAVVAAEPVVLSETQPTETVHVETLVVDEPAPVDREEEPIFATAASPVDPVPREEKIEVIEVPAASSEAIATVNPSETIAIQANAEEQKPDELKAEEAPEVAETVKAEEPPAAEVAPKTEETPKPEETSEAVQEVAAAEETEVGPAPSEEELAQALRLLTPALGHADLTSMPARETLVVAGAMLAEEAARNASEAPRWVAAAVALSPEEAVLSLETEMFRTLAGAAAAEGDSAPAVATAAMSPAAESGPAAEVQAETPAEALAETMAAVPAAASEAAALSAETVQAEPNESPTKVSEEAAEEAAEEPVAATFADAMLHDEIEAVSALPGAVPVSEAALPAEEGPPVGETMEVPTSEATAEGEEAMARERAKTRKSNWHQIRTGSAAAGTNDVVEAAKQAEAAVEEAPKDIAATAAMESASASGASPDANTIASIVDSVLADLRPKIVEEIAKKLAGK